MLSAPSSGLISTREPQAAVTSDQAWRLVPSYMALSSAPASGVLHVLDLLLGFFLF